LGDKKVGIIHFDRHVDTQETDLDERMHTCPWFHATNMKNAPAKIQELFSRNELIKKLAEKKYLLSSPELDNLLGDENHLKIKQYSLFEWRNWRLIPKDKKYWKIEKKKTNFL